MIPTKKTTFERSSFLLERYKFLRNLRYTLWVLPATYDIGSRLAVSPRYAPAGREADSVRRNLYHIAFATRRIYRNKACYIARRSRISRKMIQSALPKTLRIWRKRFFVLFQIPLKPFESTQIIKATILMKNVIFLSNR